MEVRKRKQFDDFQEHSQLLLASRIFNEYLETRATIIAARRLERMNPKLHSNFPTQDMEPELFVDSWIKEYVYRASPEWKEGVFRYFIKLLVNYPNAMR